jgi:hypothetical protein
MIKPKYLFLIFALVAALAISMLMSSCKKCYRCYLLTFQFHCVKGSSTVSLYGGPSDIAYYENQGYTCDTLATGYWSGIPNSSTPVNTCGKDDYQDAVASGDSCVNLP